MAAETQARPGAATALEAPGNHAATRLRLAAECGTAFVLAAATTALSLRASLHSGRLAAPPTYDDVGYLLAARRWIADLSDHALGTNLYLLLDQHAPVWTWLSIIGLALEPAGWTGPYVLNGLAFTGFYVGLLLMMRDWPFPVAAAAAIAAAQIQFLCQAATELRPDILHGACLGLCVVSLVRRPFLTRPRGQAICLGLLVGLILVMKPTACLPTAALVGATLILRLALDLRAAPAGWSRAGSRGAIRAVGVLTAGAVVVAGPVFTIRAPLLAEYIWENFFGAHSADWAWAASRADHLHYYVDGFAGSLALGAALWVCLATFGLRLAVSAWRRRADLPPLAALAAVVVVALAIPNATPIKTYFLGSMFYATLVVAAVVNVMEAARGLADLVPQPEWARHAVSGAALVVAAASALHVAVAPPPLTTQFSPQEADNMRRATDWLRTVIRAHAPPRRSSEPPLRVALSSPYPIARVVLELYAFDDDRRIVTDGLWFQRSVAGALAFAAGFDLLVISSATANGLPGARLGDELIGALDASSDYSPVNSFDQTTGGVMRAYERRAR